MAQLKITNAEHKLIKKMQREYSALGIEKSLKECYQELGQKQTKIEKEIKGWWFP